jgi:hypothetical protein
MELEPSERHESDAKVSDFVQNLVLLIDLFKEPS